MKKNSKYSIIRLISLTLIFFCHVFQYYNNSLSDYLNVGVILFFLLSGYLYGTKEVKLEKKWYLRQYFKIMLPYLILFVIMLLIEKIVLSNSYNYSLIIKSILGIQGTATIKTLTHTWFISYILLCYAFTPFLNFIFNEKKLKFKNIIILVLAFTILIILNILNLTNINVAYVFSYVFGYVYSKTNIKCNFIYVMAFFAIVIQAVCNYNIIKIQESISYFLILWSQVLIGIALFKILLNIKDVKYNKFLYFTDKYSYYFYLVHQIFILNYFSLMKYSFIASLVATVISGIMLHFITLILKKVYHILLKIDVEVLLSDMIIILLVINPILDIYIFNNDNQVTLFGITLPTIIRFGLLSLMVLIYTLKYKKINAMVIYFITLILYSFIQYYNCNFGDYNYIVEVKNIFVLVFPFIFAYIFYKVNFSLRRIEHSLIIIAITLSTLIIVPTILGISLCSYSDDFVEGGFLQWFTTNNGYMVLASKGIFYTSITSCAIMIIVPYVYNLFVNSGKLKYLFLLFCLSLSSIMIGTKASSYGIILILISCLFINLFFCVIKKNKFNLKNTTLQIIMLLIIAVIFINAPIMSRIEDDKSKEEEALQVDDSIAYRIVDSNNKFVDCNNQEHDDLIEKIESLDKIYIPAHFINDIYSYKDDPVFWCNFINFHSISDYRNNRLIESKIAERLIELNNKKSDNYFGYGYSKITKYYNVESDFKYQYYCFGIVGFLIICGLYLISFITFTIFMFKYKKFNSYNCNLLLSMGFFMFFAYYSGNTLSNLGVTIIIGCIIGLLCKSIFTKRENLIDNEITIFALHLNYGGVEKYISSLCKMLESNYKINLIVTYKINEQPAFEFSDKINIKYLISNGPNKNKFVSACKNKNVKEIIIEGFNSIKLLTLKTILNVYEAKKINSKYVITTRAFHNRIVGDYSKQSMIKIATEHNFHDDNKKYIKNLINSIKNFDYLVVVSNNLKEFYKNKIGKTKCLFIPNVIDEIPEKKSKLDSKNLITIGRLSPEKGQKDLIDVFKLVNEKLPKTKLYIAGDGPLKNELEDYTKELKLENKIVFTGFLGKEAKEKYILDSSIFVLPSYTESFGLVLIEAMSYGLPCIAFDSSDGAKELLKNNVGILIKNRDKEEMARRIIEELEKTRVSKYSENGYNYCQRYLIDNVKDKWLEILK